MLFPEERGKDAGLVKPCSVHHAVAGYIKCLPGITRMGFVSSNDFTHIWDLLEEVKFLVLEEPSF